jgi:hypothetical protein
VTPNQDERSYSGTVSTDDLETLLSGHDPVTGTRLGNPLVDAKGNIIPAVAGFDASTKSATDTSDLIATVALQL